MVFGFGWWTAVQKVIGTVFSYLWPIALICSGVYVVQAARAGRLKGVTDVDWEKPFGRSVVDKRIAGVCGGIAQFFSTDSTLCAFLRWPCSSLRRRLQRLLTRSPRFSFRSSDLPEVNAAFAVAKGNV